MQRHDKRVADDQGPDSFLTGTRRNIEIVYQADRAVKCMDVWARAAARSASGLSLRPLRYAAGCCAKPPKTVKQSPHSIAGDRQRPLVTRILSLATRDPLPSDCTMRLARINLDLDHHTPLAYNQLVMSQSSQQENDAPGGLAVSLTKENIELFLLVTSTAGGARLRTFSQEDTAEWLREDEIAKKPASPAESS
jgi:hypothetical protein